jgi:hypothetical protein
MRAARRPNQRFVTGWRIGFGYALVSAALATAVVAGQLWAEGLEGIHPLAIALFLAISLLCGVPMMLVGWQHVEVDAAQGVLRVSNIGTLWRWRGVNLAEVTGLEYRPHRHGIKTLTLHTDTQPNALVVYEDTANTSLGPSTFMRAVIAHVRGVQPEVVMDGW